MKGHSRHNSLIIGRKNQAKFENDCVSRNGLRIKITQPNSMILVSFSSAEDALLFNIDFFKYYTFGSQGTENLLFRFFGDTRYSMEHAFSSPIGYAMELWPISISPEIFQGWVDSLISVACDRDQWVDEQRLPLTAFMFHILIYRGIFDKLYIGIDKLPYCSCIS